MTPEQLIADIHRTLDSAQARLAAGEMLSLDSLGEQIATLCNTLSSLPAAAQYRTTLEEIRTRLDTLNTEMQASQRAIALSLASLATGRKAATAYRNQPTGEK